MVLPAQNRIYLFIMLGSVLGVFGSFFNSFRSLSCGFLLFAGNITLLLVSLKSILGYGSGGVRFSLWGFCLFFFLKTLYLFLGLFLVVVLFSNSVLGVVLGALLCFCGVVLMSLPCFDAV